MLTSYDQYIDACRELCRAQADVVATMLADAERVNQATGRLLETLQARHQCSRQRFESAGNIEELFDIGASTLGEDIAAGAHTFVQMWREIAEVQMRAMGRLPEHASHLGTLYSHVMQFAGGLPQPLIPLGAWLYGFAPASQSAGPPTPSSGASDAAQARQQRATG